MLTTQQRLTAIADRCRGSQGKISLSRADAIDLAEAIGDQEAVPYLFAHHSVELPCPAFVRLVDLWNAPPAAVEPAPASGGRQPPVDSAPAPPVETPPAEETPSAPPAEPASPAEPAAVESAPPKRKK